MPRLFAEQGAIRIIGGQCRGRTIRFPIVDGLRPTPNRVRETLFNWLTLQIDNATCLDLFAGSGALSFEAMSRGAKYCLLFDASSDSVVALKENKQRLNFTSMDIVQAIFPYAHTMLKHKFDIVFLDPPFHQGLVAAALAWLENAQCLHNNSVVYVESESDHDSLTLTDNWQWVKDKRTGQVRYSLIMPTDQYMVRNFFEIV